MVSSVDRNWMGGISSGLDTQSLIDKTIRAESYKKFTLERERNSLGIQRKMLQDINLKLFTLQSKATDLTFSKTFKSKTVESTDSRRINALATTEAAIGSYVMRVKQIATATSVSSSGRLAGSLELGQNLSSEKAIGGAQTSLSALGVTPGDLKINLGDESHTISSNATESTTVDDYLKNINASINNTPELKGKVNATYDKVSNKIKFNLLDSKVKMDVEDASGVSNGFVATMFDSDGSISLNGDIPVVESGLKNIKSGNNTTLRQLGLNIDSVSGKIKGKFTISHDSGGTEVFDLTGMDPESDVDDLIKHLNKEIDGKSSLVKGDTVTGNPNDRIVEFRLDAGSGKLQLVNTNPGNASGFTVDDDDMDSSFFHSAIFGSENKTSTFDEGKKLAEESFSSDITDGKFTVDGVQINIDPTKDTLQGVLSRITSKTNLNATYDSETDTISLTRKDGSNAPIGVGSSTDSSNFLSVVGIISGSQSSSAKLEGSLDLSMNLDDIRTEKLGDKFGISNGSLEVVVNGNSVNVDYTSDDTLDSLLEKIGDVPGIESAYYDVSTGKINIVSEDKGTDASLEIKDVGGRTFASKLGINGAAAHGLDTGSSLTSNRPISNIKTSTPLAEAGFPSEITAGSFSINGVKFNVANPETTTIDSLVTAINKNDKVGVKAHYDSVNGSFILTSVETGNKSIAIGDASDTSNFLSAMGITGTAQDVGQNAIYSIDGFAGGVDQVSQSNSISDAIKGVTLDIIDVTGAGGETITVGTDTESAMTAINEFIELYNEVTAEVYKKLTERSETEEQLEGLSDEEKASLNDTDLQAYEKAFSVGLLSGDNTLRSLRSQMRDVMSSIVPGVDGLFDSLSDIGITTGIVGSSYENTMVGTLTITDKTKLEEALKENPDKVAEIFGKDGDDPEDMGIARRLKETLNEFTKSDGLLTSRVGRSGVTSSNSEMEKQIKLINAQISAQASRLISREEALISQFASLETAMSKFQAQSSSLTNQLSQLTGG